ncbi:cystatin-8 [Suncus etruscus]|uniref:cystatin-8 n=1 Tax=Suncus etruscus TaxID=109475 RepID=UPI00211078FB|nr:cystatin-8 [Suncus etruscus]
MVRLCTSQLLLVVTVVFMCGSIHARSSLKVIRKFQDIPSNYVYAQQALWFSMKDFNKNSNDKYSFKVVKILKVQEQVAESLNYFLVVKIARTTCKKFSGENGHCLIQKNPKMKKMLLCNFIVAFKPWTFEHYMLKKQCKDV